MLGRLTSLTLLVVICAGIHAQNYTRFAVIGDYGADSAAELGVSQLVHSWLPDFVVTVGDNNYDTGSATTIDRNIGKYYHDFIFNYLGTYGAGSPTMRFLPCPGNHDWGNVGGNPTGLNPYLAYFTLPGNERYYQWRTGPVEIFLLDSDTNESDGYTSGSVQAIWCHSAMTSSTAKWKVVVFHHAAYSSGQHGSTAYMQWPFQSWGATAVLSGHDHTYERLQIGSIPYFVNGLGGKSIYSFLAILPQSRVHYNADYGAMLVTANMRQITFQFYSRSGLLVDQYTVYARPTPRGG